MPRFTRASDLRKHLEKAASALQAETLITAQADLGSAAISPVDTGRFRSSWFAAEGTASSEVAPEGANSPNTDAASLRVDYRKDYHLTNSLPYAQRLCVEGWAVSKSPNWFNDWRNHRLPKIQQLAAKTVKAHYEL